MTQENDKKIINTIKQLKKVILLSKKESEFITKEEASKISLAYGSIMKQIEKKTIGVEQKNIVAENVLIYNAANTELKEQLQSKNSNAPYSPTTIEICSEIIEDLMVEIFTPEELAELKEIEKVVVSVISELGQPKLQEVIIKLKKEYSNKIDMKKAIDVAKSKFVD